MAARCEHQAPFGLPPSRDAGAGERAIARIRALATPLADMVRPIRPLRVTTSIGRTVTCVGATRSAIGTN